MKFRDIVDEIRKIRERTRDPRGHDFFAYVDSYSYDDELLREFGFFYRAQLAVARDLMGWHEEVVAHDEARLGEGGEADSHLRYHLAESVEKHEALFERWQAAERRILDDIDKLEEPFFSA